MEQYMSIFLVLFIKHDPPPLFLVINKILQWNQNSSSETAA